MKRSIPINLDEAVIAKIDKMAEEDRRSRTSLLRLFVEKGVEERERSTQEGETLKEAV